MSLGVWKHEGRTWRHGRHPIFYTDEGSGPPLLLLHGFPTASWDWHRVWPALARRFRVVAPDLIGYGFSAKPRRYAYTTFDQADLVEGLLAFLDIDECRVLAHDYGDTVAQELLARRLERPHAGCRVRAVCLLNGGIDVRAARPRPIQKLLLTPLGPALGRLYTYGAFRRALSGVFGPDTPPSEDDLASFWELLTCSGGKAIVHKLVHYLKERERYRDRWIQALRGTAVPLRFVCGTADPVSGLHMAERYVNLVPHPDVVLLEGIGHYPQVEAPDRVLEAFLEFVER